MTEFLNTISAGGAAWTGSAPAANAITGDAVVWAGGGMAAEAAGSGALPLSGGATGLITPAALSGTADGGFALGGIAAGLTGPISPSARRFALPEASANGGRIVRPD